MREPDQRDDALGLAVFAGCWAFVLILSKLSRSAIDSPWGALTLCLAALVLLRPRSVRLLVALAAARCLEYATDLPSTTQHFYLNALFASAIVMGWGSVAWRRRTLEVRPAELFRAAAPGLRLVAITCLFWAGLAKVNHDFIDPATSCAAELYDYQRYYVPLFPDWDWIRTLAPWLAIVGELGAALLLLHRRTRLIGVWLGILFMLTVAMNPHNRVFVFAGPTIAVLATFTPAEVWRRLGGLASAWEGLGARRVLVGLGLIGLAVLAVLGEPGEALRRPRELIITGVFYTAGPLFVGSTAWAWWQTRSPSRPLLTGAGRAGILLAALVFAHQGLMVVGLNSMTHFNMASNYMVSPAWSNHLLFRAPALGFNEPVSIRASSNGRLRSHKRSSKGWSWLHFSDQVARRPNASVTYDFQGERVTIERAGDHPELFRRSWYAHTHPPGWVPYFERRKHCGHIAPQNRKPAKPKKRGKKGR